MSDYWEDALRDLVIHLDQSGRIDLYDYHTTQEVLEEVNTVISTLNEKLNHNELDDPRTQMVLPAWWTALLRLALSRVALELELDEREALDHIAKIVTQKQYAYGHGNIAKFGMVGIIVRTNDKYERLMNLYEKGDRTPAGTEPLVDSWVDLVGYSIIALMWMDGTFMLDLKPAAYDGDYNVIEDGHRSLLNGEYVDEADVIYEAREGYSS